MHPARDWYRVRVLLNLKRITESRLVLLRIALAGLLSSLMGCYVKDYKTSAITICGQFVEERVGTRIASYADSKVSTLGEHRFAVASYTVVSGYRRKLLCVVDHQGDDQNGDQNWKLVSLSFLN